MHNLAFESHNHRANINPNKMTVDDVEGDLIQTVIKHNEVAVYQPRFAIKTIFFDRFRSKQRMKLKTAALIYV